MNDKSEYRKLDSVHEVQQEKEESIEMSKNMNKKASKVTQGCNCLKSKCSKNYCECYNQGILIIIEVESAMNFVNVWGVKIIVKIKIDLVHLMDKMQNVLAFARNLIALRNIANAIIQELNAQSIVNARNAKTLRTVCRTKSL